ncbi:unnamed protein product [Mesocestoides corti]|nr:unnamed protein product [Mesocestoides corti]
MSGVSFRRVNPTGDVSSHGEDTSSISCATSRLPPRSRVLQHLRRLALPLALGQFLSALIAVTGIASNYLVNFGVSLPLAQNLPHYFLLSCVYGVFSWHRLLCTSDATTIFLDDASDVSPQKPTRAQTLWSFFRLRGWHYLIAGTIDVHANWAIVSAYNYTNLTSVQLLDCLTIPTAMILSRFCLKVRYKWMHITGVVICLAGAGAMVGADYLAAKKVDSNSTTTASQTTTVLLGDFLVIIGAVAYGASNVYQEYLVRRFGIIDYLGFAPLAATFWTVIYCVSLEYGSINSLIHASEKPYLGASLGCLAGFAAAMFLLYTVFPFALSRTDAVLVNLSLLTADLYALLIGIYLFGNIFHPLYLVSFAVIMLGVCTFASRDPIFRELTDVAKEEDGA